MSLAIITDPFFYVVAVPAVLMLGLSKSGFGAGFGSLAVPMIALSTTVPQAAAVLMPILLATDLLSVRAFRKDFDRELLKFLIPMSLVGIVIGALTFKLLDAHLIAGIVGAFTLLFLAQRLLFPPRPDAAPPPKWAGALLTITCGFTSFAAHAGSPPINAYMIPLKMNPVRYSATMAVLFLVINLSKWIPYGLLGLLDLQNMSTALVLLPLAPIGVMVGVRIARRIEQKLFYQLIYVGMLLSGLKLLWDGFRG